MYPGNNLVDVRCVKFRRFLKAGPVASETEPPSTDGMRVHHLVQIYTDPGGMRTLSAADIRLKRPREAAKTST